MNILLLDITDNYPFRYSANNSKAEYIARGLSENGCDVTIINGLRGNNGIKKIDYGVSEQGIKYITFPKNKYFWWLLNSISLIKVLIKSKADGINGVIIGMNYYHLFVFNSLFTKIIGYKNTTLFHEWHICFKHKNAFRRFEAWIKDNTFGYLMDGIFPISSFLEKKSMKFNKKILVLPIIANFPEVLQNNKDSNKHFVYCAQADYFRIVKFVIEAYTLAKSRGIQQKLILVLYGKVSQIENIKSLIKEYSLENYIEIKTKLLNEELFDLYRNALGLMIPLDPESIQDTARFSQKIAEYVSSGRPIITSNTGEISNYFKHEESAIIVPYTIESYCDAMLSLSHSYELASKVGIGGRNVGLEYFDYNKNGKRLFQFFEALY